jgi:elongation factor P
MKVSKMEKGQTVMIDGQLYTIVDFEHVKLSKGPAVYQTKLKRLSDGTIQNARLRSEDTIEDVELDERTYEYLYSTGDEHILMDMTTFDQITVGNEVLGDSVQYLTPNIQLQFSMYEGKPIIVKLPNTVDLKVTDTMPEVKGATVSDQRKPATLQTGLVVQVPAFIKVGEIVRVDTRTGLYVTRVKE